MPLPWAVSYTHLDVYKRQGMYTALWAGFVPYLKAKLSIGEDVLGSMILLLGVGSRCV